MSEFEQAWQARKAERGPGCNPRTEFKAGWCAAIDSLEANRANETAIEWGVRYPENAAEGIPLQDWLADDEWEARYEQENFGGVLITRPVGAWAEVTSAAQATPAGNDSGVSNPAPVAPTGQGARDYPLRAYLAKTLDNIEDETRSWTITDVRAFITGALEIADEVTR